MALAHRQPGCAHRRVLKAGRDLRTEIATEVAALHLAERHALPTPRVIAADLDGERAGSPAL
ncbi:MAG TPA: hypothetical protein VF230_17800 [Acidimicrobiales bacterium]